MFRGIANNPNFKGLIAPVTPEREYGLEGSPEWDYFQQQVSDYRAGRKDAVHLFKFLIVGSLKDSSLLVT